jgi:hypothetical protein
MKPLSIAVAVIVGVIVLLGYFISLPVLQTLRATILDWAVILAGIASLIAVFNLVFGVHWRKIRAPKPDRDSFSIVLVLAFILTFAIGIVLGPSHEQFQQFVLSIQLPIEASLMGVLAITLAYASLRFLQRRKTLMGWVFLLSTIAFLLMTSGYLAANSGLPFLKDILNVLGRLPVAGARGLLLGIGLGSLTAGLRILLGADRPYGG